jgi:membrane protease YdiL (CAAX protease family)
MDTHLNTKRILIFLAFTFGITFTAALVFYLTVLADDLDKASRLVNYLNYFFVLPVPALANVATRLITKEGWGGLMLRPNFRRGWRFYLAAWGLPLLAVTVGGVIYYLLFPQSFDPNLSAARKEVASIPFLAAASPWSLMLVITLNVMIAGGIIYLLFSIGEEFGWRGYLLPKLIEHFNGTERASASAEDPAYAAGVRKATLLIGVIWGLWHWPGHLIAMKLDPETPILLPLVTLVSICSLSVFLSWVTLRSGSVWPAAIGHGMFNAAILLPMNLLKGPANLLLGPQSSGLIGGMGYLALALVLFFSRRAFAGEKKQTGTGRVLAKESPTLV